MKTSISRILACGLAASVALAAPASARPAATDIPAMSAADTLSEDAGATLAPGAFLWRPERGGAGALAIVVDLDQQLAYVYRGETLIGLSTVSSGRDGYETPVGSFTILQKEVSHRSNLYDAPMPYMERLTWDGVALHAGGVPGYRESHGCVHLPVAFAKALFAATRLGASVTIRGSGETADPLDEAATSAEAAIPADSRVVVASSAR